MDVAVCSAHDAAADAMARVLTGSEPYILIHRPGLDVPVRAIDAMRDALSAPTAASASPVPTAAAVRGVAVLPLDPRLPPPPTVSAPSAEVCLLSRAALASIPLPATHGDWGAAFAAIADRLVAAGWRHVAAPGAGWAWMAPSDPLNGLANEGLATHCLWAETRTRPVRLVVDGACLTDDPHNGSQAVVWNIATALKRVRPDASVHLAVSDVFLQHLGGLAAGSGVVVVSRKAASRDYDAVYRPYQPLEPGEIGWLTASGKRLVTSQLDMIAFSNPGYHPSPALFHAVRNLQRRTMRLADGVTFISEFGRDSALAECPDLDISRTSVVLCGADAEPIGDRRPEASVAARVEGRFVACVSATFWHKNRQHAIRVFDALCRDHDYRGLLVIAGPEPYYGRSTAEDNSLIGALDPHIRERVVRVGLVDARTKWWLLERADLVLYPSVVEGFGLVPFEAAAVDTPCLAPSGSALGEVLGGSAALVPEWDVGAWAQAASRLIDAPDASAALVADVRARAAGLTWDASAERTWTAIDAALAAPRARLHEEEGGLASRVSGSADALAPTARLAHFANRVRSYGSRRLRR